METTQPHKLHDVMVTCPETKLPLATGVQLNPTVFAGAVFTQVRVRCPHCEGEHRWSKSDAYLVEVDRSAPPLSAAPVRRPPAARS